MRYAPTLSGIGALTGLYIAMSKRKSFWTTAGFCLLFGLSGAALGTGIELITKE